MAQERTKTGLAAASVRGKVGGREPISPMAPQLRNIVGSILRTIAT